MRILYSLILLLLPLISFADATFNVGTYNIRLKTTNDSGEREWDVRKPYVVRTITECGFDVIGLNEMNGGVMFDYLKEELTQRGYDLSISGVRSTKNPDGYFIHPVVYRRDMFDLVDNGVYYLNIDTTSPGTSWDNSGTQRATHWARLRVKETGDEFYFFITHLDHQGQLARNEQCRINMAKIREIAGNTPALICGDHNSNSVRLPFYNLFSAYMDDTMHAAEEPFAEAKDGTHTGTFNPNEYNTSRLDYIWVRGFSVLTHEHLRETFGASILPSDHLAVKARVTLHSEIEGLPVAHLRPGARGGDGSAEAPFGTFAQALESITRGGTIKVTAGEVSPEGTRAYWEVDKSVTIEGGYNDDFTEVTGVTAMHGDGTQRFIYVDKKGWLELRNFSFANGYSDNLGGAICCYGPYLWLRDVTFTDCSATTAGGAVYAAQQVKAWRTRFVNCSTGGNGGAVMADYKSAYANLWWRYTMHDCEFSNCSATSGSAFYAAHIIRLGFVNCSFIGNYAKERGTVYADGTRWECELSFANSTFAGNVIEAVHTITDSEKGGSAVFARLRTDSSLALMNCTIIGNSCTYNGTPSEDYAPATIMVTTGKLYCYSNIIGGNTVDSQNGKADILVPSAVGAYNCYSCAANISHRKSLTDIISADNDEALDRLKAIYGCDATPEGLLLPEIGDFGGFTPTAKIHSTVYGDDDIRLVPKTQFEEALTHADVNDDADLKSTLATDQRGFDRRRDGTSTLGATEYGEYDSAPAIAPDDSSLVWRAEDGTLTVASPSAVTVADLAGRIVASSPSGNISVNVRPGIYIIMNANKAIKTIIK